MTQPLCLSVDGRSNCSIFIDANASHMEIRAAYDLSFYMEKMSGAQFSVYSSDDWRRFYGKYRDGESLIVVGSICGLLSKRYKQWETEQSKDAVFLSRVDNIVYVAGSNDRSHYYAAMRLLDYWGCRWFLPGKFGECIPQHKCIEIDHLDEIYVAAFDIRDYFVSWLGDTTGHEDFKLKNGYKQNYFHSAKKVLHYGLAPFLDEIKDDSSIVDRDKTRHIDFSSERIISGFVDRVSKDYQKFPQISFACDFITNRKNLNQIPNSIGMRDKFFNIPLQTDRFFSFYNEVARRLAEKFPNVKTKIAVTAYSDLFYPPQKEIDLHPSIYVVLINTHNSFAVPYDSCSLEKVEFKSIIRKWQDIAHGRLIIYDLDQTQQVWREMPNNPISAFRKDFQFYRELGVLGIQNETRGIMSTTMFNHYIRGKLLWNPDLDLDILIDDFCQYFYGPLAIPMSQYWHTIINAWSNLNINCQEHWISHIVFSQETLNYMQKSIYETRELLSDASVDDIFRLRFRAAEMSYDITSSYMDAQRLASVDIDYRAALKKQEFCLQIREDIGNIATGMMTPIDTILSIHRTAHGQNFEWPFYTWMGEVESFREIEKVANGKDGYIILKTNELWSFVRDRDDSGVVLGWARSGPPEIDIHELPVTSFIQSHRSMEGFKGVGWYFTDIDWRYGDTNGVHLMFPEIFNDAWLYINGSLVSYRSFDEIWWLEFNKNNMRWDINLNGKLNTGINRLAVRIDSSVGVSGIHRRPFIYRLRSII